MRADILDVLTPLGSSGVSDVADALGQPFPLVPGLRPVSVARPVAGRAVTMRCAPVEPAEPRAARHLGVAAIEVSSTDSIVVIAGDGDPRVSAAWGGLLSRAARRRGIRATVLAGLCRDADEARDLGYPVYALGTTPRSARGRLKEVAVDVEITLAGVAVRPGDYLVADSDGVVVVPAEHVDAVARTGSRMLAAERGMAERLHRGEAPASVLGAGYERLTEAEEEGG